MDKPANRQEFIPVGDGISYFYVQGGTWVHVAAEKNGVRYFLTSNRYGTYDKTGGLEQTKQAFASMIAAL